MTCGSHKKKYHNTCLEKCQESTMIEAEVAGAGVCYDCDPSCATCVDEIDTCTSCWETTAAGTSAAETSVLYEEKCIEFCPAGTTRTLTNNVCLPCDAKCATCKDSPKYCLQCEDDNHKKYEGDCLPECPEGTYDKNGQCEDCDPALNCKTCALDGKGD